jgi:hypothetical protein
MEGARMVEEVGDGARARRWTARREALGVQNGEDDEKGALAALV